MPRGSAGLRKRLLAINHPAWTDAMVRLLAHVHSKPAIKVDLGIAGVRLKRTGGSRYRYNEPGFHRWHDSGDLQSVSHLGAICEVARLTPTIKHWLPTQELGMVQSYVHAGGRIPDNLVIRVSSIMIDDPTRRSWPLTSSVFRDKAPSGSHVCPAQHQEHRCGSCRACWSPSVQHVAYPFH